MSVCEELADHEANDKGDEETTSTGEREAEERLDRRLICGIGKFAILVERFVGAAEGQPEVEKKKEGKREKRNKWPVATRTKREELGKDDGHEGRDEDEAGSRPVVIAVWGLLMHSQVFQVFRICVAQSSGVPEPSIRLK